MSHPTSAGNHSSANSSHPPPPPLATSAGTAASALHSQYRRALSTLFLDIKTEEERRIEQSKAFLLQTLMSLNGALEHLHEKVRQGIVAVTSIDASDDLRHFIDLGHLHLTEEEAAGHVKEEGGSLAPVTVFDLTPPTRDAALLHRMYALEVEWEGMLARPGRFFRKQFKEHWVAVSRSGWLHCWEERTDTQPVQSLSLADTHAVLEGKAAMGGGWNIDLHFTRGGGAGRSELIGSFRAATEEEAKQWVDVMNKYAYPTH